jgi:hypothetical protein
MTAYRTEGADEVRAILGRGLRRILEKVLPRQRTFDALCLQFFSVQRFREGI